MKNGRYTFDRMMAALDDEPDDEIIIRRREPLPKGLMNEIVENILRERGVPNKRRF